MYKIIKFFEERLWSVCKNIKIFYWKIKYGKRIKIGRKLSFRKRFNILIEKNGKLTIGDNCFFNRDCSINCLGQVTIGDNNLFGENVKIYDHNHKFTQNEILKNEFNIRAVKIGNSNWIGTNVTILSKAEIRKPQCNRSRGNFKFKS